MHWTVIHITSAFVLTLINLIFKTPIWKNGITYQEGNSMGVLGHFLCLWVIIIVLFSPIGYFLFR